MKCEPRITVKANFEALADAFDSSGTTLIDRETGEVVQEELLEFMIEDGHLPEDTDRNKFLKIDPFPSNVSFGIMEDFVEKLEPSCAKDALEDAIRRSSPFRLFRDTIRRFPEVQNRWYSFKKEEMEYWVPWWVRKNSTLKYFVLVVKENGDIVGPSEDDSIEYDEIDVGEEEDELR